jgi:chaperonin GroES
MIPLKMARSFQPKERREETFMASIKPLQDRIIIKRIEEQEQIRGGIIIPDTAKEKPQEGEVIAVGEGKKLDNGDRVQLDVKEGDRVLFGKYAGTEIKLDGEEYLIMREDDILGVIERAATSEGSKAKGKATK